MTHAPRSATAEGLFGEVIEELKNLCPHSLRRDGLFHTNQTYTIAHRDPR